MEFLIKILLIISILSGVNDIKINKFDPHNIIEDIEYIKSIDIKDPVG